MKLLLIILILFPLSASGLSFKKKEIFIKFKTDKGEYTYMSMSDLVIVYDTRENEAHVGYHKQTSKPDNLGQYKLIFISLKVFEFGTQKQFNDWIKSVRPYDQCLTLSGLVKCD